MSNFGKPRRRHAWVAFELGLRSLELPHLLTWKASPSFTIPPTPMHAVSGLPALNGPAACITVKTRTPPPGGLPSPNGPASLPPPGSGATNGTQTIPPVRLALPPHLARTRTETSTSQRPPVALCALAPEARKGLWLNLGVARAASFGPAPCVMPKPRLNPSGSAGQTGLKSLWYPTHSHASESLHFGSLPTHRDDQPWSGVPRKLAGRSPGAD